MEEWKAKRDAQNKSRINQLMAMGMKYNFEDKAFSVHGVFAAELSGRQAMQNIGRTRQLLSQSLQELDNKVFQIQEVAKIAQQDAEDKGNEMVRQAKAQLDQNLAAIRAQKGELQSRKAEFASNAVQLYQQTVQNVKAQNAAFMQNLISGQLNAENTLKLYRERVTGNLGTQPTAQEVAGLKTPVTGQTTQPTASTGGGQANLSFGGQSDIDPLTGLPRVKYG